MFSLISVALAGSLGWSWSGNQHLQGYQVQQQHQSPIFAEKITNY